MMRRWDALRNPLMILSAAVGVAVVVVAVGDAYKKARQERRSEVEELVKLALATVASTVGDIVAPEPQERGEVVVPGSARAAELAASVSPYARPAWADPVAFGEDDPDGLDDPTDLTSPYDDVPEHLMAVASLAGSLGPFEPVPEETRLSGPGRAATFGPGENPLSDIGERPAWEED